IRHEDQSPVAVRSGNRHNRWDESCRSEPLAHLQRSLATARPFSRRHWVGHCDRHTTRLASSATTREIARSNQPCSSPENPQRRYVENRRRPALLRSYCVAVTPSAPVRVSSTRTRPIATSRATLLRKPASV